MITVSPFLVVCPVIDVIDEDTLEIHFDKKSVQVGGFDWGLQVNWIPVSELETAPFYPWPTCISPLPFSRPNISGEGARQWLSNCHCWETIGCFIPFLWLSWKKDGSSLSPLVAPFSRAHVQLMVMSSRPRSFIWIVVDLSCHIDRVVPGSFPL